MARSPLFTVPEPDVDAILQEVQVRAEAKRKAAARTYDPKLGASWQEADEKLKVIRTDIGKYGEFVFGLPPARVHRLWNQVADDVIARRVPQNKVLFLAPPNSAKALALDTPIPTPSGWTTMGDLQVGDEVFGADGRPIRVIRKSPVFLDRPVYRVRTHCGEEIIADEDHIWRARLDRKCPYRLVTTAELAHHRNKAAQVERAPSLDLPEADLPIPPYILGLWLGDGHSASARITALPEDAVFYRRRLLQLGYETTDQAEPRNFNITGLIGKLRTLGVLNNKHIPTLYLRASTEQRMELLRGLIDTDGTVSPKTNAVSFCTTNRRLAEQVCELVRSLGMRTRIGGGRATLKGRDCGEYYRLTFMLEDAAHLPRKAIHCRTGMKTPRIALRAEPAGRSSTVCITVDAADGMFLAGRAFTPTHNSTWNSLIRPTHYLGQHPDHNLLFFTSSDPMAKTFHGAVESVLRENEKYRQVFPDKPNRPNRARGWSTDGLYLMGTPTVSKDGAYRSVGFGTSVMGARANGIIIDDPMNQAQAQGEADQARAKRYYDQTVVPRLQPETGWLIAVMTRFHENDLAAHFLRLAEESGDWIVIRTPQIATNDPEPDPVGRATGELLWPERLNAKYVEAEQRRMSIAEFNLVHQADPTGMGGDIFESEAWFQGLPANFWDEIMPKCQILQAWDLAFSERKSACYTVGLTAAVDPELNLYILHLVRKRLNTGQAEDELVRVIQITKPLVIGIETDKFHQALIISMAKRILSRVMCNLQLIRPTDDKIARARLPAGRAQAGKVFINKNTPWYRTFVSECLGFPNTKFKDQVDTLSLVTLMAERLSEVVRYQKPVKVEMAMSA